MQVHDYGYLPATNATLNGISAVLLVVGHRFIGRGRVLAHRNCMIAATVASAIFLGCYLYYHFQWLPQHLGINSVRFAAHGWPRPLYFALLLSHTVLAAVSVPLILLTLWWALRSEFTRHSRVARWTYPIWVYVGVTGVLVYLLLYKVFPA